VDFSERGQEFTAHVLRLRALYMVDARLSASVFIQVNSAGRTVNGDVRLRYNPREGVDLYLLYDESLNSNRTRESPPLPLSANRRVLLKCSYTFAL
jgi:hypothetical protein